MARYSYRGTPQMRSQGAFPAPASCRRMEALNWARVSIERIDNLCRWRRHERNSPTHTEG